MSKRKPDETAMTPDEWLAWHKHEEEWQHWKSVVDEWEATATVMGHKEVPEYKELKPREAGDRTRFFLVLGPDGLKFDVEEEP